MALLVSKSFLHLWQWPRPYLVVDCSYLCSVYGTHEPSCGGAHFCVEKALILDLQIPVQDGSFNTISNVRE
jgi:hypothetical protein